MKKTLLFAILCAGSASAATLLQTRSFTIDESYTAVTGPTQVFDDNYLSGTVDPFNGSLGTLESFTLTWTLSGNYTGPLANPGGATSIGYNGDFLIQGLTFPTSANGDGSGGGGFGGGGAGGTIVNIAFTSPAAPTSFTRTFFVSGAGSDYDAAILTAVLGGSPLTLKWNTALSITGNFDTLDVDGAGSVQLTYNYTAVPEPSAALLGLAAAGFIGLRRRR